MEMDTSRGKINASIHTFVLLSIAIPSAMSFAAVPSNQMNAFMQSVLRKRNYVHFSCVLLSHSFVNDILLKNGN